MTQQVVKAKAIIPTLERSLYRPTMDFIFEQLGSDTAVNLATVVTKVENFFNGVTALQSKTLSNYMSPVLSQALNACSIEIYDITSKLNGAAAGAPIQVTPFTMNTIPTSQKALPEPICVVCSYRANYGSAPEFAPGSHPRARLRGRFFFGPLNASVLHNVGASGFMSGMDPTFFADLGYAFHSLIMNSGSSDITGMVQWSRKAQAVNQIAYWAIDGIYGHQDKRRAYQADLAWQPA